MFVRYNPVPAHLEQRPDGHYITGLAAVFPDGTPATEYKIGGYTERISPNAFNRTLATGRPLESRYNHSPDHVLGRSDLGTVRAWVDSQGLRYEVRFNPNDPDHLKVQAKLDAGLITGSSIAFQPIKYRFFREAQRDICLIEDCELHECGPVNHAAYSGTLVDVRSQEGDSTLEEEYRAWKEMQELLTYVDEVVFEIR